MQLAIAAGLPADRVTDDLVERTLYSRDLAPVPALLTRPFFRTLPDAVVRPRSARQVAEVVREAAKSHVAVTPRAAASTSYYDAVPARGGLVLDVNDMRGGIDLDPARGIVRVLPATTWFELDDALRLEGFAVRSYPSSALSATVGGWISTQGHGIGSLKYGAVGDQLVSLEVVLPNGELRTVSRDTDPPLDWFVSAEGTLGVVTGVELAVRARPEVESHHLLAFDSPAALAEALRAAAIWQPCPFTLFFADAGYLGMLAKAGFDTPVDPAGGSLVLLASFQGDAEEVRRGDDCLVRLRGRELSSEAALEEWNSRLFHLRAKRGGPSLLAAEQWLPLGGLGAYLEAVRTLSRRDRVPIGTYGVAVAPDWAMVMSIYPADERNAVEYLAAIGYTRRLHNLGARHGARPYGVGLWNTPYLSRLFTRRQMAELRRRKQMLDPLGIMNPGKLYRSPFPLWPVTFDAGAAVLAAVFVALGRRR
ncbi:MAG: FAD-binding oxidoreductase [Sphingomonadaceae bacterium]